MSDQRSTVNFGNSHTWLGGGGGGLMRGIKIPPQDFALREEAYLWDTTVLQLWFTVMFKASNRPLDAHNQVNCLHIICCHSKSM